MRSTQEQPFTSSLFIAEWLSHERGAEGGIGVIRGGAGTLQHAGPMGSGGGGGGGMGSEKKLG